MIDCQLASYKTILSERDYCMTRLHELFTAELCTLIDNRKLANQIAMLLPIVVKLALHTSSITKEDALFSKFYILTLNITIIEIIKSTLIVIFLKTCFIH